jgi:hypothetical protein
MTTLKPDQHNANRGTKRGKDLLKQSLQELGAGRSILVDKDGQVIAGNKTLEQAQALGMKIRVIEVGRDELVAVQRPDLDLNDGSGEARRLAYLDNRVSELDLDWDPEVINADLQSGIGLDSLGFMEKELQELTQTIERSMTDIPDAPIEQAAELRIKWGVEKSQIWQLGDHRLCCGDCCDPKTMAALMDGKKAQVCFTDPPWNVNYGGKDHPN